MARATPQDFEVFWQHYPRKIGKLAAKKAFDRAVKSGGATLTELLDGIAAYLKHKPAYADWAHPSTWLNAGRWMDEYDDSTATRSERPFTSSELAAARDWGRMVGYCPHTPSCESSTACRARYIRTRLRLEESA